MGIAGPLVRLLMSYPVTVAVCDTSVMSPGEDTHIGSGKTKCGHENSGGSCIGLVKAIVVKTPDYPANDLDCLWLWVFLGGYIGIGHSIAGAIPELL